MPRLILGFTPLKANATRIDLVHIDVADADCKGVSEGWPNYYWQPWWRALAKRERQRR